MNAEIDVKTNTALTLPEDAIVNYENKIFAFVVKGQNSFEMTEVKTGVTQNVYVEVNFMDPAVSKQPL